ncbi:transcriptional adapter 2 [Aspergillus udagawae]|uniref:Transcriptional adapter 2 n=1 Tax=Aspergillus udagawae TaxID=91492 RepID=A0A8H3NFQ2_9EURO|nr:transcriptional adapter 2 [Aspergillus udagawae]
MGVIRKKTASRGTEAGTKYHCDICSADVTSTVRISCAHPACHEYDLCVPCFAAGEKSKNHDPSTHPYQVIEQNSVPIFEEDWGADEELLLLEGAEIYGLGSWADIADHIGGYRTKDEVRDHYIRTYIESSNFPLPERADPDDTSLQDSISKEEFQARKKRRIEERKEAAKAAPPTTPKQKPTASVPACHEVQGYMPGRLEFETEFMNEAEEAVQHMTFEPGAGETPNGETDAEMELKMTVVDIYNSRLTARTERKKILFEHNLLEYRKNTAMEKKRTKEEKDLLNKAKPFARMMNHEDFEEFNKGLEYEHNLRLAIAQLQEWRQMGIGDLKGGEKYEQEKQQRAQRLLPQGSFDRFASTRPKQVQQPEQPSAASQLTTPELPLRLQKASGANKVPEPANVPLNDFDRAFASNGDGLSAPQPTKTKFVVQPLNGVIPWKLENEGAPDLHLLTKEEVELCNVLHIQPKPYLVIKETLLKEAMKQGGSLKKKDARAICKTVSYSDTVRRDSAYHSFSGLGLSTSTDSSYLELEKVAPYILSLPQQHLESTLIPPAFDPLDVSKKQNQSEMPFTTPPPNPQHATLSFPSPHILLVTLNRPRDLNCINTTGHQELNSIWHWLDDEPSLRVGILTGTGRAFCAGADLKEWNTQAQSNSTRKPMPEGGFGGLSRRSGKKPVICAVNGLCLGGGCEMVVNADLVVACRQAFFGLPEVQRGVVAIAGALPRVVRTVGRQRAMEMALTGRRVSADEAKEWGFVNEVVDEANQVVKRAIEIAELIAANSPDAVVVSREGIKLGWEGVGAEDGSRLLVDTWSKRLYEGENIKEGLRAFVEKRKPKWVDSKL